MPESLPPDSSQDAMITAELRGVHYDFLKERIPSWFLQATTSRQEELAGHELALPNWYLAAPAHSRQKLATQHNTYREALNRIESSLASLEDVQDFARPHLLAAVKRRFNLEVDVDRVFLARKYARPERGDLYGAFVLEQRDDSQLNYEYRGETLLEAALANFEPDEEQPLACGDCQVITAWPMRGHDVIPLFADLKTQAVAIAPHEFAGLCRELDVGKLYQEHIRSIVQPQDGLARNALHQQLQEHHRQLIALGSEIALYQRAIGVDAYQMLQRIISDNPDVRLAGKPVTFAALKVFGSVLVGPLLMGPQRLESDQPERVVVYIPNDPEQPVKEYASSGDFMNDLRARLHKVAYRRFFSRFVPVREQGAFFQNFNSLYQPEGASDAQVDYPLATRLRNLPIQANVISTDSLWVTLRQAQISKILSDARAIAVPTEDENRQARIERLEGFKDALINLFNLAAFVVPGLGPLMMTVGAAQMCGEVFEGFEAYETGDIKQMWAHFSSVALNVGMIAAGAKVIPAINSSRVVDSLRPVTLANGKQALWKPDLSAYAQPSGPPAQAIPDTLGLYAHAGRTLLPLEGRHYQVTQDPATAQYRVQHPTRAEAYQPLLRHNEQGAWVHEAEEPREWHGARLMRRLGPMTDGFSDEVLEHVRTVSGIDEETLRRLHAESEAPPAVLLDTLRQFRAYADARSIEGQIRSGQLTDAHCGAAAALMVELPGWPQEKAIEVTEPPEFVGQPTRYGNVRAARADTISISRSDLMAGELPRRVAQALTQDQAKALLGQHVPAALEGRREQLQLRLADYAQRNIPRLFESVYRDQQPSTNPSIQALQRDFKGLPTHMARELLAQARPADVTRLAATGKVPLHLAELAHRQQRLIRLIRAHEGLHLDELANVDTETLALNTLSSLPGWADNLRIEVRDDSFQGALRTSFGPSGASNCKVLVRMAPGKYQALDEQGNQLHGINSLYGSLQHALTDRHRASIGVPHVGQGAELKGLIIKHALPRDTLRQVLGIRPERAPYFRAPQRWPGRKPGYSLSGRGQGQVPEQDRWRTIMVERIRTLYPHLSDWSIEQLLQAYGLANDSWLRPLEREYKAFDSVMLRWLDEGPRDRSALLTRRKIYEALKDAWRGSGEVDYESSGRNPGQRIELEGADVGRHLETLPLLPANFAQVTNLTLDSVGLTDAGAGFLHNFPLLRRLHLDGNELTQLPPAVAQMLHLRELWMSENDLVLTPESVGQLRNLRRLEVLSLALNPLGRVPDISRMPNLIALALANTGITRWPVGLFAWPRSYNFFLEMTSNPILEIPDVAPGSESAQVLARTVIDSSSEHLPEAVRAQLKLYIESVGRDPDRRFPLWGIRDSHEWKGGLSDAQWIEKQQTWDKVEGSADSEPFFNELRKLVGFQEAGGTAFKEDLTGKVWRMLDAMAEDTELRERLFDMAKAPTTCVDAGAQLFNSMGVEVLLQQARMIPDAALRKLELRDLAQGKSRLDELGKIARARVMELLAEGRKFPVYDDEGNIITQFDASGQALRAIDEVEIHLKYTTRLAQRLDLPWQPASMVFPEEDVTDSMVESAFKRVIELEQGDLLRDNMIEQPFWAEFVESAHPEAFKAVEAKNDALIELIDAQEQLADDGGLSAEAKSALHTKIETLAGQMGKAPGTVTPGRRMSDPEYYAELDLLGQERIDLLRRLTDQEMGRTPMAAPEQP